MRGDEQSSDASHLGQGAGEVVAGCVPAHVQDLQALVIAQSTHHC